MTTKVVVSKNCPICKLLKEVLDKNPNSPCLKNLEIIDYEDNKDNPLLKDVKGVPTFILDDGTRENAADFLTRCNLL